MKLLVIATCLAAASAIEVCVKSYSSSDCTGSSTGEICASGSGSCGGYSESCQSSGFGGSTKTTCTCFPADASVLLEDGSSKLMKDIKVGDRVQVSEKEFSDVYMFSHKIIKAKAEFVKLTTEKSVLHITAPHYLYVNGRLATAGSVKTGDKLKLASGEETVVLKVATEWKEGIYNPHTLNGDIVVNGIKTSTYTTAVHPTVAHAILAPLRALYQAGVNVYSTALEKAMPLLNYVLPSGVNRY